MMYLIAIALIVVLCLVLRIAPRYLYTLVGLLLFLHPLLLSKGQAPAAFQVSIVVFLVFLSALIVNGIARAMTLRLDERDPFIITIIRRNIRFRLAGFRVGRYFVSERYSFTLLVALCLFAFWRSGFTAVAFVALLFIFIVNRWSARIIAAGALLCLVACPILLVFQQEELAERFAVYAYYLLALTTVLLVIEQVRDRQRHDKKKTV